MAGSGWAANGLSPVIKKPLYFTQHSVWDCAAGKLWSALHQSGSYRLRLSSGSLLEYLTVWNGFYPTLLSLYSISLRYRVVSTLNTSPVKWFQHSILFIPRTRKKLRFVWFVLQPITTSVLQCNATCDWPTAAAAIIHTVWCHEVECSVFDSDGVQRAEMPPKCSELWLHGFWKQQMQKGYFRNNWE